MPSRGAFHLFSLLIFATCIAISTFKRAISYLLIWFPQKTIETCSKPKSTLWMSGQREAFQRQILDIRVVVEMQCLLWYTIMLLFDQGTYYLQCTHVRPVFNVRILSSFLDLEILQKSGKCTSTSLPLIRSALGGPLYFGTLKFGQYSNSE